VRATWLTDIHLNFLRPLALKAFYDRVKAEKPDALLVTGDIAESDSVGKHVAEMSAIAPVYFVLGNHDFYRSNIRVVRGDITRASKRATYMPAVPSVKLTDHITMIGVDGWGDARCGDLESTVQLSDWNLIEEFKKLKGERSARNELLQRLGTAEARLLKEKLDGVGTAPEILVLTHVPPFPEACIYDGEQSSPAWTPWFTCIATGEVLEAFAKSHPSQRVTVLCGHSHGIGDYQRLPNLEVKTGGWPPHVEGYGNPIVQMTFEL
jgi:Icc-related predicted phosphoesterase